MPSTFGDILYKAIRDRGLTIPDFAGLEKTTKGRLSKIYSGSLTPPIGEELERWISALRLGKAQAAAFREAALLAHAPAEVGLLINDLRRKLTRQEQELTAIRQHLVRAGIKLPEVSNG